MTAATPPHRIIKVFIASPGDLAVERRAFKEIVDTLNQGYGRGAKVTFVPLGWEDVLSQVGPRAQELINQDIDACDVFVLAMWRRWGQPAPDAAPYTSYTEEEFYRALARYEKDCQPKMLVFFKQVDPACQGDPGPEMKKVLKFRKTLAKSKKVIYRQFKDDAGFKVEIDKHLTKIAEGFYDPCPPVSFGPIVPASIKAELKRQKDELAKLQASADQRQKEAEAAIADAKDTAARREAEATVAFAKASASALALAKSAAKAALEGRLEEARQNLAQAVDGTTNLTILDLAVSFYRRQGELPTAEQLARRALAISGPDAVSNDTAATYRKIGTILQSRDDLGGATDMYNKALGLYEALADRAEVGGVLVHLGTVAAKQERFEDAESLYKKALDIPEMHENKEFLANAYGNLGILFKNLKRYDEAERALRDSLAIETSLNRLEGMASDYGNLGVVFRHRGDLAGAKAMYNKSLEIETRLGRLLGMASDHGNLASIAEAQGDLGKAREHLTTALNLYKKVGARDSIARVQRDLGTLGTP